MHKISLVNFDDSSPDKITLIDTNAGYQHFLERQEVANTSEFTDYNNYLLPPTMYQEMFLCYKTHILFTTSPSTIWWAGYDTSD